MRTIIQSMIALLLVAGSPSLVGAQENIGADFTSVARIAVPCVVSIKVQTTAAPQQNMQDPRRFQNPQDEIFRHFFGIPAPGRPVQQPQTTIGQGSGFLVTPDGYILTNNHVVNNAQEIVVTLNDGREFAASIVGQDPNTDVAVIKIEAEGLPFLRLGDSTDVEQGQWVVAIGNPLGLQATLTVGVLSAKGRNNLNITRFEDYLQVDAAINRGNSGGPLLDTYGRVIGINTAIVNGANGIGFAIPSNMAQNVMDQLIAKGTVERGYLGLMMQSLTTDLASALGLEKVEGALVTEVADRSPAARAGVRPGDVIVRFDGSAVENPAKLSKAVAMTTPGHRGRLVVWRDSRYLELPIEVCTTPGEVATAGQAELQLGLEVKTLTPQMAQQLGQPGLEGAVVTKVNPGSPSAVAQLQPGQIIVAINHEKVTSAEDFYKTLGALPKGSRALVWVKHGANMRFVAMKVD